MCEMLEVISKTVLLLGLFYFGWKDYETQMIEVKPLILLGIIGVILRGTLDAELLKEIPGGMQAGVILLCVAKATSEQIGFGDGLLFLVTGIYLNSMQNFTLLLGAFILIGAFSIGCMLLKKKGKDDRVAMAPFVLASYVLFVL